MRRIVGLIVINIMLITTLSIVSPYFLTRANLVVMADNIALETIILSGYALLLIGGYFDLSVDGIVSLTGVIAGLLMVNGIVWYLAVGASFLVSVSIGIFNGIVVTRFQVNGLIATLTTWWVCVGLSLGLTKAVPPYGFPEVFGILGQSHILGFKSFVLYAIIIFVVLSIVLHCTKIGAWIYATGDNKITCEMMGINTARLGIGLYALMGTLAGLVGLILSSRLNASSPVATDGMALRVVAALVIGGVGLNGGTGTLIGGFLGLLIMHIFNNAVIQLGISPYYQKAILGTILLVAVLSERLKFSTTKGRVSNVKEPEVT
jgi:ribose transport system permease protein